ncbi:MAG TPA: DUF2844 domain-containing protein [Steroidobacteraceae bacterium]|nr:DUF2844 domain-containing protein [Steroidobacteraceae bacterium]
MRSGSPHFAFRGVFRTLACGVACAFALVLAQPASAALGGGSASIAKDQAAMRGILSVTPMQSFAVHRLVDPAGQTVREYADRTGRIFAVTWSGSHSPDLQELLGAYYGRYLSAAALHRTGHHIVAIRTPGLVLSVVDFQRSVYGRAYLPSRLPSGFTPADLR